jgi:hypothetical protein
VRYATTAYYRRLRRGTQHGGTIVTRSPHGLSPLSPHCNTTSPAHTRLSTKCPHKEYKLSLSKEMAGLA